MLYYWDIINAFISLTSVPSEFDQDEYREISSAWGCVKKDDGSFALKCLGDVFLMGCEGLTKPFCPPL